MVPHACACNYRQTAASAENVYQSGLVFGYFYTPGVPEDGGGRGVEEAGGSCCRAADLDRIFLAANFEEDKTTEESKVGGVRVFVHEGAFPR